jgi:hypothetical protein
MITNSPKLRISGKLVNWYKHYKEWKNHSIFQDDSVSIKKQFILTDTSLKNAIELLYTIFKEFAKEEGNDIVLVEEKTKNTIYITIFQILDKENVFCYTVPFFKSEIFTISLNTKYLNSINKEIIQKYPSYNLIIKKKFFSESELKLQISNLIQEIDPSILEQLIYYINELKNNQECLSLFNYSSIIESPKKSTTKSMFAFNNPSIIGESFIGPPPGLENQIYMSVFNQLGL